MAHPPGICGLGYDETPGMEGPGGRALLGSGRDVCVAVFEFDGEVVLRPPGLVSVTRLREGPRRAGIAAGFALAMVACAPHGEAPAIQTHDAAPVVLPPGPIVPAQTPVASERFPAAEDSGAEVAPCDAPPPALEDTPRRKGKLAPRRMGRPARPSPPSPLEGGLG